MKIQIRQIAVNISFESYLRTLFTANDSNCIYCSKRNPANMAISSLPITSYNSGMQNFVVLQYFCAFCTERGLLHQRRGKCLFCGSHCLSLLRTIKT